MRRTQRPVNPRASQTLAVAAAAVKQALICSAASAPVNRSAFCTPFSEFTAALPFTSKLNCGLVVSIPRDVGVNRCVATREPVMIAVLVFPVPVVPVSKKLAAVLAVEICPPGVEASSELPGAAENLCTQSVPNG